LNEDLKAGLDAPELAFVSWVSLGTLGVEHFHLLQRSFRSSFISLRDKRVITVWKVYTECNASSGDVIGSYLIQLLLVIFTLTSI
jgi:hypothetical protein